MYPWLLYLLSASSNALPDQRLSTNIPRRIWWSPIEPRTDLKGFSIVEGDILRSDFEDDSRNALKSKRYLWPNGVIPYELGDDFNESEKNKILEAMKDLESQTCIKYEKRKDQRMYMKFRNKKDGCYATLALVKTHRFDRGGPRLINLDTSGCISSRGLIQHELLHIIGLAHEQSRPDRDDYVTINWENILKKEKHNFYKGTSGGHELTTFDIPYDYDSLMHYDRYSYSKNGKPTITAKGDPNRKLGQMVKPSAGDIEKVLKMYNCNMTESNNGEKGSQRQVNIST